MVACAVRAAMLFKSLETLSRLCRNMQAPHCAPRCGTHSAQTHKPHTQNESAESSTYLLPHPHQQREFAHGVLFPHRKKGGLRIRFAVSKHIWFTHVLGTVWRNCSCTLSILIYHLHTNARVAKRPTSNPDTHDTRHTTNHSIFKRFTEKSNFSISGDRHTDRI